MIVNFIEYFEKIGEIGYCPACIYSRQTGDEDMPFECVRKAPSPMNIKLELSDDYKATWPIVYDGDTCGEGMFETTFVYE